MSAEPICSAHVTSRRESSRIANLHIANLHMQLSAASIAALGTAFVAAGSWVPSVWYDEAATITGSTRSWGQLWVMLHNVDAVHAIYYAGMHVWFNLVGYSPFTLRFPSAVAIGVASFFTALIAARMSSNRAALCAAILVVLIPRLTFAGAEGRSYAFTAMLAAIATWLVVSGYLTGRRWMLYGVVMALMIATFLFSVLIFLPHAFFVSKWARSARVRWLVWSIVALLLAAPVGLLSLGQSKQVGWLSSPTSKTVSDVAIAQFGGNSALFAGLLWAAAACGVVVVSRTMDRRTALGVASWALAPTLLLVVISFIRPVYDPRYVTFSAPAMALLAGVAVGSIRARSGMIAALLSAALVSVPTWYEQRAPGAKDNANWQSIAAAVARDRGASSGLRDVAIFGPLPKRNANSSRLVAVAYPRAFYGMGDLTLARTGAESGTLWGTDDELAARLGKLSTADRIISVRATTVDWPVDLQRELERRGFRVDSDVQAGGAVVTKYVRK